MARQCLSRNRLKRRTEELKALTRSMSGLTGDAKAEALKRAQQLTEEIKKLNTPSM